MHVTHFIGSHGIDEKDFARELGEANRIELILNSCGGDALVALAVHDLLKGRDEVTCTVIDLCASAAVWVALCAKRISIQPSANVMIHPPRVGVIGTAAELRARADELETMLPRMLDTFARTKVTRCVAEGWLTGDKDVWLDANKSVGWGLADEVIGPPPLPQFKLTEGPSVPPKPQRTEAQDLFSAMLHWFKNLRVRDKAEFESELKEFFLWNVHEAK